MSKPKKIDLVANNANAVDPVFDAHGRVKPVLAAEEDRVVIEFEDGSKLIERTLPVMEHQNSSLPFLVATPSGPRVATVIKCVVLTPTNTTPNDIGHTVQTALAERGLKPLARNLEVFFLGRDLKPMTGFGTICVKKKDAFVHVVDVDPDPLIKENSRINAAIQKTNMKLTKKTARAKKRS